MTKQEWLDKLKQKQDVIKAYVVKWHPASAEQGVGRDLPITAPNAESARRECVEQVKQEDVHKPEVAQRWDAALEAGDTDELANLMDAAWFGVPESIECWDVAGFKESVELLGDPPEEPESQASKAADSGYLPDLYDEGDYNGGE